MENRSKPNTGGNADHDVISDHPDKPGHPEHPEHPGHPDHPGHGGNRLVQVTIDNRTVRLEKGAYVVTKLKELLGVPADYELDQVVHGEFKPLADDQTVHVHGEEVYISHVKQGASS